MSDEAPEIDEAPYEEDEVQSEPDVAIEGDSEDQEIEARRFVVSSYGWDSDVEGLVKRLNREDIYIPGFQRGLVWDRGEKSRLIESLILGLPVPTVFLAQDFASKRLNIVDGQQRLRSLQQYLNGEFALGGKGIPEDLQGRYYSTDVAKSKKTKVLTDVDARALADALVHSVVIKPDPVDNDKDKGYEYNRAVIQIFYRLNSSGRVLQAQEIRASIYHGSMDDLLRKMNDVESWRALFGNKHGRLKDVEAVLRYLSLLNDGAIYKAPMPKFLDGYMERNRNIDQARSDIYYDEFRRAASMVLEVKGPAAFKQGGTFVLSRFDAMMTGIVSGLRSGKSGNDWLKTRWDEVEADKDYMWSIEEFVNDTNRVTKRIERASTIFTK